MKTLLTTLLTLFLFNNAYACINDMEIIYEKLSFTSPEKCSKILNTVPNQEISSSLVSKYGNCINSHFSKIIGKPVDGKVKFFPSSGYIGMNIDDLRKATKGFHGKTYSYQSFGPFKWIVGVVIWVSLSDDDNPFEWHASPEDGYNFIYASKYLYSNHTKCENMRF